MANVKVEYAASAALTMTLASLASDTNLLAGRQSTAVDNSSNKYLDYLVGGKVKAGTSPTASKSIELWLFGQEDDTPTYPDTLGASDANVTMTTSDIKNAAMFLIQAIPTDSTTGRVYWFRPTGIAQYFGGAVPKHWGIFIVHNMGVALDSTGGNHVLSYQPIYATVA